MNRTETIAKTRRAVAEVLRRQGYVSAVDVLMQMGKLEKTGLEDWRMGRVPFLEKILVGNLSQMNTILREMASCCREMKLKESVTDYRKWGKGAKLPLRFSKSGEPAVERAYATHYVSQRVLGAKQPAPTQRRIEMDPDRLEKLAEARWKDHVKLREELKFDVPEEEVDALFHRIHDDVSKEVDCTRCANCCIQSTPVLDESDIQRIAVSLGITAELVKQRYLKMEDGDLVFAAKPCSFLEDKRCSIYEDRPRDCRGYPHLRANEMARRLLNVLGNAGTCPIVYEVLERIRRERKGGRGRADR